MGRGFDMPWLRDCFITENTALELYPWYVEPLTFGIFNPLPMIFRPPNHGISILYLWYVAPPLMVL
jgi:hypothetical protein